MSHRPSPETTRLTLQLLITIFALTATVTFAQQGDVISTNSGGRGRTTKTTGTQGVNHGKGGNKTCRTTKNTPSYNPNTCASGDVIATNGDRSRPKGDPPSGAGRVISDVITSVGAEVVRRKTTPTPTPKPTPSPTPKPKPTPKPERPRADCVELEDSDLLVDSLLRDKPQTDYNCHYYTKTFINQKAPGWPEGAMSLIREKDLRDAGYKPINTEYDEQGRITGVHLGDVIILTGETRTFSPYLHSAIITNTSPRGAILSLRQKLNPEDCVAETNWEYFKQTFMSAATGFRVWSHPDRAGRLERAR
jgi:hypothetical protein